MIQINASAEPRLHASGMRRAGIVIAAALLLAAPAWLTAQPVTPEGRSVELEPLVITGQPDPLDRPLLRLRALLDASAPCLGCDASTEPTHENKVLGLVRFLLLPAVPPPRDAASRAMSHVRCSQAGPEMDYLCP